jgi:radical SAM superfamily enzyme YgiQ (UPF0313 family)
VTKKLLLINPAQHNRTNLASLLRLPPASLAYLVALTASDWQIKIVDENVEPLTFEEADLVGLTAYTCNAPRAYDISQEYRRRGTKTVIGGVHVSVLPSEAANYADSVVIGEAETVWHDVLGDFEKGELKPLYYGDRTPLTGMVKPDRSLYPRRYRLLSVETSRGCPNDCEFCSVPAFYGRTHRQRPVDEVLDELEALKAKWFFFTDDNILGYGKKAEERAIQLFQGMIDRGIKKRWGCYVGIDFAANQEVLKHAKKAGCLGVFIGFESINRETLEAMNKVRNLRVGVEKYKEVIKALHGYGIGVLGSFVLGNDGDDKDVFDRTTEFILNSSIDVVQLSVLNPFPGTRLYERLKEEERLLCTNYPDDWKRYDFMEVLYRPKHMTPEELSEGVARVYKDTTSRLTSLRRAFTSAVETRDLLGAIVAYLGNRGAGTLWAKADQERTFT